MGVFPPFFEYQISPFNVKGTAVDVSARALSAVLARK